MLHITNGDAAAEPLRAADLPGEVTIYTDLLHEGPVPAGLDDAALRVVRASFLASQGYASVDEANRQHEAWDRTIAGHLGDEEIVLWFEHDLFDQLLLVRHLDWFARQAAAPRALSLVCIDRYPGIEPFHGLGQLDPDAFRALFPARRPVMPDDTRLAQRAWSALRAEDPSALEAIAAATGTPLPFVPGAVRRLLEEYPWIGDGLARTDRQGLEAVAGGAPTLAEAFRRAAAREEAPFLGDWVFFARMRALGDGRAPLLDLDPGTALEEIASKPIALTEAGRAVLGGVEDAIGLNGIDRWIGGVHLLGAEADWRWDPTTARLVATV